MIGENLCRDLYSAISNNEIEGSYGSDEEKAIYKRVKNGEILWRSRECGGHVFKRGPHAAPFSSVVFSAIAEPPIGPPWPSRCATDALPCVE